MTNSPGAAVLALAADLGFATRSIFFPLMLMLNFSFFQYLVLLFHSRWREPRVLLLLLVSGVSVVTLVPFATQNDETVANLNDVSESCLALILLVQTALVGTRYAPKGKTVKAKPGLRGQGNVAKLMQFFADLIIVFDCGIVILGLVCVFKPHVAVGFGGTIVINNVAENVTLAFTFVYRFGELVREKGWRRLLRDDRREIACHVVFMLHEYPFMLLERVTHVSWEYLQAIFMRLALAPCVWMTIGEHHAQRVSVFFHLPKLEVPVGIELKDFVRSRSLMVEAGAKNAGAGAGVGALGGQVGSSSRLTSSRALPEVKRSAVIDATAQDEREDEEEENNAVVKPTVELNEIERVRPAETSAVALEV